MKLGIVVTHYKEKEYVGKKLFDSMALQRGINFSDVNVMVVNDGTDVLLSEEFLNGYPFNVDYKVIKHAGVSAARNVGIDNIDADYIMFCDFDDMFLNNYAFHMIFGAMQEGFEFCSSSFVEEMQTEDGSYKIVRHDKDITFIHGKIYNLKFLKEKNVRFCPRLTIHEDGYFNTLAHVESTDTRKIESPFYLWCWNNESVVRTDTNLFLYRTYSNLMDARAETCREYKARGYIAEYMDAVVKTVFDSYYDFQKPEAIDPKNKELIASAELAFKQFYKEFGDTYKESNITRVAEIAYLCRANAYVKGLRIETSTVNQWLTHIVKEVK